MKVSKKPRHWIALAIAVAALVVAVMQLMDFSAEGGSDSSRTVLMVLLPLMVAINVINLTLDGRE